MRLMQGGVQFHLQKPTKTYSVQSERRGKKLQLMTVKEFTGNSLLCPLTTLLAYIDRTKYKRGAVDNVLLLMTTQEPRAACVVTVVLWAKNVMTSAGLGEYKVHSNRSVSSTLALLMGMPMDVIIDKVGWVQASTFIKHYMKPLSKKNTCDSDPKVTSAPATQGKNTSKRTKGSNDPHGFMDILSQKTPKPQGKFDLPRVKARKFKQMHDKATTPSYSGAPTPVYGPTGFAPNSPASTIAYEAEVNEIPKSDPPEVQKTVIPQSLPPPGPDPFDFDTELANIREQDLINERTVALADHLKKNSLELAAGCISPPHGFGDDSEVFTSDILAQVCQDMESPSLQYLSEIPDICPSPHDSSDQVLEPQNFAHEEGSPNVMFQALETIEAGPSAVMFQDSDATEHIISLVPDQSELAVDDDIQIVDEILPSPGNEDSSEPCLSTRTRYSKAIKELTSKDLEVTSEMSPPSFVLPRVGGGETYHLQTGGCFPHSFCCH